MLDILSEVGILWCRAADAPIKPNVKLLSDQGEIVDDPDKYRRLVGRLNYLTVTIPDITFAVSVLSQFFSAPMTTYWDAIVHILKYLEKAPDKRLLY